MVNNCQTSIFNTWLLNLVAFVVELGVGDITLLSLFYALFWVVIGRCPWTACTSSCRRFSDNCSWLRRIRCCDCSLVRLVLLWRLVSYSISPCMIAAKTSAADLNLGTLPSVNLIMLSLIRFIYLSEFITERFRLYSWRALDIRNSSRQTIGALSSWVLFLHL